jgi:hypothetical protein
LQTKGYATKSELDADDLAVKRKEIELDQAQEQLRLFTKYDYPKRKRALEAAMDAFQRNQSAADEPALLDPLFIQGAPLIIPGGSQVFTGAGMT